MKANYFIRTYCIFIIWPALIAWIHCTFSSKSNAMPCNCLSIYFTPPPHSLSRPLHRVFQLNTKVDSFYPKIHRERVSNSLQLYLMLDVNTLVPPTLFRLYRFALVVSHMNTHTHTITIKRKLPSRINGHGHVCCQCHFLSGPFLHKIRVQIYDHLTHYDFSTDYSNFLLFKMLVNNVSALYLLNATIHSIQCINGSWEIVWMQLIPSRIRYSRQLVRHKPIKMAVIWNWISAIKTV